LATAVKDITGGRGVDVVIDTVGASTWDANFNLVRRGGRIVLCGVTTGAEAPTNLRALYWNQVTIMGSTMGSHEDFRQMIKAVAASKLKPVIDSVRPLKDVRAAMGRMEAAEQFGKIVLRISE
jgi:NADPH:quinone reductase-like Zn-dependent oxidoreductase